MEKSKRILQSAFKILFICLLYSTTTIAQTEFFNSKIQFSDDNLSHFYSSFSIDSSQVYFNTNDYYLKAYNKKTGSLIWSSNISKKSNETPKIHQNSVIINAHFGEYVTKCVKINAKTGVVLDTLEIESINSQPIFKDSIMYCTAIDPEVGGAVMAYNLNKNIAIWKQFIAHGVDQQPYYLSNKIIANAEEDNWFEIDYNGKLKDSLCESSSTLFVENIKCVQHYLYLSHDGKGITSTFLQEYFESYESLKVSSNDHFTFILGGSKLLIVKDNLKIDKEININEIVTLPEKALNGYREFFKTDDNTVRFFYKNLIVVYDYLNYKLIKTIDLSPWKPHQVVLDDTQVWLISKNDGQLIGLELDPKKATIIEAKAKKLTEINKCNTTDVKKTQATKRAKDKLLKTVKLKNK